MPSFYATALYILAIYILLRTILGIINYGFFDYFKQVAQRKREKNEKLANFVFDNY